MSAPGILRGWPTLAALLALFLGGCAAPFEAFEECGRAARERDYPALVARLERSSLAGRERDRLLFLMEQGMLHHLAGDWVRSNAVLEEADRLADTLFTRSLSAAGASLLAGDAVIPYAGEDYELAYLNFYKALNFLALGDLAGARVECRKVDEKLTLLNQGFGGSNSYRESPLLRLLTGLVYEAQGEWNDAFIAYRKALTAYLGVAAVYRVPVPQILWRRLLESARRSGLDEEYRQLLPQAAAAGVTDETGRNGALLAVVIGDGLLPARREGAVLVPSPQGFPVKLAWPRLEGRGCSPTPLRLLLDGRPVAAPELVERLDAVARQSLEDKKGRTVGKLLARATAKQVAAAQVEQQWGALAGFGAQVAALLSEHADLRGWSSLPGAISLALLPVAAGDHYVQLHKDAQVEERSVRAPAGGVAFVTLRVF